MRIAGTAAVGVADAADDTKVGGIGRVGRRQPPGGP